MNLNVTFGQQFHGRRGTLRDFITKVDDITLLRWMIEVAKGLGDMHRFGIIHGDLKAENVIIMESGKAKIIDLAQSGYTAPYHAPEFPEVFESEGQWQSSIDIYSFGVVYWLLLFGTVDNLPERTFVAYYNANREMFINQPTRATICSECHRCPRAS
jgi:serine/threonine protein kinase